MDFEVVVWLDYEGELDVFVEEESEFVALREDFIDHQTLFVVPVVNAEGNNLRNQKLLVTEPHFLRLDVDFSLEQLTHCRFLLQILDPEGRKRICDICYQRRVTIGVADST